MIAGYFYSLIVVVAFAIYPSVAPLGLQAGATPFSFVFLAMLISSIGMSAFSISRYFAGSREVLLPPKRELPAFLLLSAIFLAEHLFLLCALQYVKVVVAMALIYTYPLIVAALSVLLGKLRITRFLLISLVICLIGVFLVVGFSPDSLSFLGVSFALAQACMAAVRILLTARLVKNTSALVLTTRMLCISVLFCLPVLFLQMPEFPSGSIGLIAILAAGCSGMIGHGCMAQALKKIHPIYLSLILNLEPVVAALLSAFLLGEVLSYTQYLGVVIVICAASLPVIYSKASGNDIKTN